MAVDFYLKLLNARHCFVPRNDARLVKPNQEKNQRHHRNQKNERSFLLTLLA